MPSFVSILLNPWVIRSLATVITVLAIIANTGFAVMSKSSEFDTQRFGTMYRIFAIVNVLSLFTRWCNTLRIEIALGTSIWFCPYGLSSMIPHPFAAVLNTISTFLAAFNVFLLLWLLLARTTVIRGRNVVGFHNFCIWFTIVFSATWSPRFFTYWRLITLDFPSIMPYDLSFRPICFAKTIDDAEKFILLLQTLVIVVLPLIGVFYYRATAVLEKRRSHITPTFLYKHVLFLQMTTIYACMIIFELVPPIMLFISWFDLPIPNAVFSVINAHATTISALTPLLQAMVAVTKLTAYRRHINKVFSIQLTSNTQ